jgi:anti-sigma factor RsiW
MIHLSSQQMFEYIDGRLQPSESRRIAVHVRECSVCRREVEYHRALSIVLAKKTDEEPSQQFSSSLMSAILNEPLPRANRKVGVFKTIRVRWLGAVAVIISLGILISSLPQKQVAPSKPSDIQHIVRGYSEWAIAAGHSITEFFTSFVAFLPIKNIFSLLMLITVGIILWIADTLARKRFLGTR